MYARSIEGRTLNFAFPRGLLNDNLMLFDRETGSLWSQIEGKAVSGPLQGTPLTPIPALQTSWGHWKALHPETEVMVGPSAKARPYFYRSLKPGERPSAPPVAHDTSELGLGFTAGARARFYPFDELRKADSPFDDSLGGRAYRVHFEPSAPAAWLTDGKGRLLPAVPVYRRAWMAFHPDSEIYSALESR